MTVLGLKLSRRANAVSNLHGHVIAADVGPPLALARRRRNPHRPHHQRRPHPQLAGLADACSFTTATSRPAGCTRMGEPEVWQGIHDVDPGELWETHYALKNLLLAFVRRRVSRQCRRRGESDEAVEAARNILDPNILTIGFARRFATYKRADLILTDLDRLVDDGQRPGAADADHLRRQGPSGRRAGQAVDQEDRQPAARPAVRQPHGLRRGLRHQRLPAPDPGRRRVAEQSPPAAGSLGHQRPEGRAQRRP